MRPNAGRVLLPLHLSSYVPSSRQAVVLSLCDRPRDVPTTPLHSLQASLETLQAGHGSE
jgi:hypothetical protein